MKLRTILAVALLAPAVAFAAPKSKPSKVQEPVSGQPQFGQGLEVGGFIGYETADLSGLSLRFDGELPFQSLSPQVRLSFLGSLGYSRLTWDPLPQVKFTANVFKIVPAARFTVPVAPQFEVFGDAGIGLAHIRASVEFPAFTGFGTVSGSSTNIMMRLGAGGFYTVNPKLRIGAMLEFDPVFGDYGYAANGVSGTQNTFLIQFGGMFKL